MGSRDMNMEPWNRLCLPRPSIQCQVAMPLSLDTDKHLCMLVEHCLDVQSLLKSKGLNVDATTLDSILYVFHHRLCYHKHYLALKQVQQCIKRMHLMGLEDSLQEILDLCPKKTDLETAKCCSVPSQPIMELVSMKILGASKLLVRLMDCCCKAFHICVQQLNLEEFIVLNVVLLGLLSRLWVMYRGIVKHLATLYSAHIHVQQEVSAFQKMPYFKEFEFPVRIEDHLGDAFNDLVNKKLPKMFSKKASLLVKSSTQLLNTIFKTNDLIGEEKKLPRIQEFKKPRGTGIDLGKRVQRLGKDKLAKFDVKALFQSVEASRFQDLSSERKSNRSKEKLPKLHQKKRTCIKHMLQRIQKTTSFKELSEQLFGLVEWCRKRKRKSEAMFFRCKLLRCNRLKYAEALGYSLKRKLQSWKKSICHSLREGKLKTDYLKTHLRIQRCRQSWNCKVTYSRKRQLHKCHIAHSKSPVKRTHLKSLCLELLSGDQEVSPVTKDTVLRPTTSKQSVSSASTDIANGRLAETDDIDDIFSSIGI